MDILTIASCVAGFFFSLGVLHGSRKKHMRVKRTPTTQGVGPKDRINSLELLGD